MKFSVLERTLPSENGTVETLSEAGEAGFDGITLQIDGPDPTEHIAMSSDGRAKLRDAAIEAGIEINTVCPSFLWQGWEAQEGLLSDNQFRREHSISVSKDLLDAAGALAAELVLITHFEVSEITEEKHKERVVRGLRELVPTAELLDVTLALGSSLSAAENAEIIDAVDSEAVKLYYDAANKVALYGFDAVEEIDLVGDHIVEYHVKDFHEPPPGFPENYAKLGEGAVDQQAVADKLQEVGFDGWVVVETEIGKPLEYTEAELAYTKELFQD